MQVSIGNQPQGTRAQQCIYCEKVFIGQADQCSECQLGNLFSDLYKDDNGHRPRGGWSPREMRAYIERRDARMAS